MNSINNFQNIFIMGIVGSGMSSIAKYLKQKGHNVEGYDQRVSYVTNILKNNGIITHQDISNNKFKKDTLYIVSSAIKLKDTFLEQYENEHNVLSRPDFLKLLSQQEHIIGITGSHGKTSTTALISHIFHFNNKNVSFIYGGISSFGNLGGHYGNKNEPLILETDEAFNTFKNINIQDLIVTNIDNDHIDYYQSLENLIDAFKAVVSRTKGFKILNYDDKNLKTFNSNNIISFSTSKEADYILEFPNTFRHKGEEFQVSTSLLGDHFLSNIVASIALCKIYGIEINESLKAISKFSGVKRRMEHVGSFNEIEFYDDYGHHPTAIKASIEALKKVTKGKLFVIFQPHRYTRTRDIFKELQSSLESADIAIVTDIYSAGEEPIPGVSSKNFVKNNIRYIKSMRQVPIFLKSNLAQGDSVLTLGAGDITLLGPQILKYLNE